MSKRSPVAWLFLVLAGGLLVANWMAVSEGIDTSPVVPQAAAEVVRSEPPLVTHVHAKLEELSETTQRPLFAMSRRPAVTPVAPQPMEAAQTETPAQADLSNGAAKLPELTLLGTLKVGQAKSRALLRAQNATAADWVDVGSEIAGWRLSEVAKDYIVLETAGTKTTLSLYPVRAAAN